MKTKLIVTNLKDFFKSDFPTPFKTLSDLEKQVNDIVNSGNISFGAKQKTLLANYDSEGYAIFELASYEFKNDYHYFYYTYNSTVK